MLIEPAEVLALVVALPARALPPRNGEGGPRAEGAWWVGSLSPPARLS